MPRAVVCAAFGLADVSAGEGLSRPPSYGDLNGERYPQAGRYPPAMATWGYDAFSNIVVASRVLLNVKQPPRLVRGKCPDCPSREIVVKEFDSDGQSYEGYCLRCGVDVIGVLVRGTTSGAVVKDGECACPE